MAEFTDVFTNEITASVLVQASIIGLTVYACLISWLVVRSNSSQTPACDSKEAALRLKEASSWGRS